MTSSEYLDLIHALPCVLCAELEQAQESPTQAHHYRHGQGMGNRASDWLVIALCRDCHQGTHGWHGDRVRWKQARWLDESPALAATIGAAWGKA